MFCILTALFVSAGVCGQSLSGFKVRLAQPIEGTGAYEPAVVTVTEQGDAADAVAQASRENTRLQFKGYRVCIYFDNGQDARSDAEAARARFAAAFPGMHSYLVYNSPYFTVTVGDCVTVEDAIVLMGKVKDIFPKAFIKNERLSLADLVN